MVALLSLNKKVQGLTPRPDRAFLWCSPRAWVSALNVKKKLKQFRSWLVLSWKRHIWLTCGCVVVEKASLNLIELWPLCLSFVQGPAVGEDWKQEEISVVLKKKNLNLTKPWHSWMENVLESFNNKVSTALFLFCETTDDLWSYVYSSVS